MRLPFSVLQQLLRDSSAVMRETLPNLLINPRRPGRHQPCVVKDLQDT